MRYAIAVVVTLSLALVAEPAEPVGVKSIQILPASLTLDRTRQPHAILVTGIGVDGQSVDLTEQASFTVGDGKVATVDAFGWVRAVAAGKTTIVVRAAGQSATLPVSVAFAADDALVSFRDDVMPVFSKLGCNSGACHGYSLGKGGFKLSLRGGDPTADYAVIAKEFLSRRVNRHQPEASLLLRKPSGEVPHRGGVHFDVGDRNFEIVREWIQQGARDDAMKPRELVLKQARISRTFAEFS